MTPNKFSNHAGMGAILLADGIAFRVWAFHADKVFVMGDFNDWSKSTHRLSHEENVIIIGDLHKIISL